MERWFSTINRRLKPSCYPSRTSPDPEQELGDRAHLSFATNEASDRDPESSKSAKFNVACRAIICIKLLNYMHKADLIEAVYF